MSNSVYILLDRSASMQSQWKEAIGSVNGYVENLPSDTNVYVAVFDNIGHNTVRNTTVKKWKDIHTEEVAPRGGTPLFDSAARVMHRILDDNPDRAIFVVMTDGEENSSQFFKQADVKKLTIDLEKEQYEVIFLGANFDKVGVSAAQFGLADNKYANIGIQNLNKVMRGTVAASSTNYLNTGAAMNFTDDMKKEATR